ncbi:hypothetical protein LUZ62_086599 [Rhynchospora pubera]|uniref:RING-type E3 ubiquitin transferase n=1 Tax=Rhynchospora pubera TaxID=906938 RepID=A0AAV8CA17_9POAL|nr:hypothetical protein LUZ62_086599 [Rhynchospora pubera]
MCNENTALTKMGKEHDKFRNWIERSDSYVDIKFKWFNHSNMPTNDQMSDCLGEGTYGNVYKAVIDNTEVAIKILKPNTWQGVPEFEQEIATLGKIRHPNVVTLIGACREEHALVYKYLPNGNLQKLLKSEETNKEALSWSERTKIAASICSTLAFLHNTKPNPIVHADLKPENILFDSDNVCKLGDFGISRFLKDTTETGTVMHETKLFKGSSGYRDPEYEKTRILTCKSDVYAFGIVMLLCSSWLPGMTVLKG